MAGSAHFTDVDGQRASAGSDGFSLKGNAAIDPAQSGTDEASSQLHEAARLGDAAMCRQLLARGASAQAIDIFGRTPAKVARSAGHFALSAALEGRVESAAEIDQRQPLTVRELTALINGEDTGIAMLIETGRMNARDAKGDSPLHILAMRGQLKAADRLVRAGADPQALNAKGRTPSEVARSRGHAVFAELLQSMFAGQYEQANQLDAQAVILPSPDAEVLRVKAETGFPEDTFDVDVDDFDLDFAGELGAEDFHDQSQEDGASGEFRRVRSGISVRNGADGDAVDWDLGNLGGEIAGDAVSDRPVAEPDQTLDMQQAGRRKPRIPAQPSCWRRFLIDETAARDVAGRVIKTGTFAQGDINDLLFACRGRFDAADLSRNIIRTFEDAGFVLDDELGAFDRLSDVDADDLTEALIAACGRAADLPGTGRLVPDAIEQKRLMGGMADARRRVQLGLAEQPAALDIILDVTDRVLEGSVDAAEITSLDIRENRRTDDLDRFSNAALLLQGIADDVRGGSSRAIRHAADALEVLELHADFLVQVADALAEDAEFAQIASTLTENLQALADKTADAIDGYLPLCRRMAAQHATDGEDQEDLVQVGLFGLLRAILKYDPEKSHNFTVYAGMWIRQATLRWRGDEGRTVRVPIHRLETISDMRRVMDDLERATGIHPTAREIAAAWGRDEAFVWSLLDISATDVELDVLDSEMPLQLSTEAERHVDRQETERVVHQALSDLPERVSWVIKCRNGIDTDDEMTLEELGRIEGVTRERIRQIEAKGMDKLRHPARLRALREVL